MIKETFYKDRPAIELSCDKFTALFLPKDGGKLASFNDYIKNPCGNIHLDETELEITPAVEEAFTWIRSFN